jgi:hypothetical protein
VAILVQASPTTGTTATAFTITWSSAAPSSGFVFDVQVRGPADSDFVDLLTDQAIAEHLHARLALTEN